MHGSDAQAKREDVEPVGGCGERETAAVRGETMNILAATEYAQPFCTTSRALHSRTQPH